jgi:uncharacterized protein YlzI (FlbEa/FlbD family)
LLTFLTSESTIETIEIIPKIKTIEIIITNKTIIRNKIEKIFLGF